MDKKSIYRFLAVLLLAALLVACANRGSGPQGGPKDENPPVFQFGEPSYGAVNVDTLTDGLNLYFDELVAVKDAYKYVLMSPPLKNRPGVKNIGKRIKVDFSDTLQSNTTYTIYFGNSIVDNNEGNPLKDFTYVFSTSDVIDSCYIEGYVIDAHTLNPKEGMIAGIYLNATDSTFLTTPFYRVAKTDAEGYFHIANIKPSDYTIYALNDAASSWYYSQGSGGEIAFLDNKVTAQCKAAPVLAEIDSVAQVADSVAQGGADVKDKDVLVLRMFKELPHREYFKKATRKIRESFTIVFGHDPSMEPRLRLIDGMMEEGRDSGFVKPLFPIEEGWVKERVDRKDSIVFWITDSTIFKMDTLKFEMTYMKTDSLENLVESIDTLSLVAPKVRDFKAKKRKRDDEKMRETYLGIGHNIKEALEVPDTISFTFEEPIKDIKYDGITLSIAKDTLFNPVPITFEKGDSACNMSLKVLFEKEFGSTYKINLDSACIVSIYGKVNDKFYKKFELKKIEQYSNLYITFKDNPEDAILELMDGSEKVKYRSVLEEGEVAFQDVVPGNYYLRMFIDSNRNGVWDSGDLKSKTQPETLYYFPKVLNLPANWDVEQLWDHKSFSALEQRPSELKKSSKGGTR